MNLKQLLFPIEIKSPKQRENFDAPKVYTNDLNSAEIVFQLMDCTEAELTGATASVLIYMRDKSFFQASATVVPADKKVTYLLTENQGNHSGLAKVQLVVISGAAEWATPLMKFEIVSGLETKVATEVMIQDWTTLTREANDFLDAAALAEQGRVTAESSRATAESSRVTAEGTRVSAESSRVTAESARVTAESNRAAALAVKAEKTYVDTELAKKADKVQEGWITPTLLNGWANSGGTTRYKKDQMGVVWIEILVTGGTAGSVIFTLPVGYRPGQIIYIMGNASGVTSSCLLGPTGGITHNNTGVITGNHRYIFCFRAEA